MDLPTTSPAYPVGVFSRTIVRYPVGVMVLCFIVSAGLAGLAIGNNTFEALGSWSDFSSIIVQREMAFNLAKMKWHMLLEDNGKWEVLDNPEEDDRRRNRRRLADSSSSPKGRRGTIAQQERRRRRLADTAKMEFTIEVTGADALQHFETDPEKIKTALTSVLNSKSSGDLADFGAYFEDSYIESTQGTTAVIWKGRATLLEAQYQSLNYDSAWSFMEAVNNWLDDAVADDSLDAKLVDQCGGCAVEVGSSSVEKWTEWVEDVCAQQTSPFEEYHLLLMFRDKSGRPLSPSTLQDVMKAQVDVTKINEYNAQCLRKGGDGARSQDCVVLSSPVNWVAAFLGSTTAIANDDVDPSAWDDDTVPAAAAACLNIDQASFENSASVTCFEEYLSPPRCSANDGAFAIPSDAEAYLPVFRAMCESGQTTSEDSGDNDACDAIRGDFASALFGKKFMSNCGGGADSPLASASAASSGPLLEKYSRVILPAGTPLHGEGRCDDNWDFEDEMFDNALAMIDPLFAVAQALEDRNEDMKMYFTWVGENPFFDYYLNKDLMMLVLSFVLVFIVLWIQTSSLFITCAGMFEIIISFPLGLFVWGVLMDEPGVTYLMYNGIFIILGIGCDDIFVFIDAFRQSELQPPHISGSLETRFAWAYNRAALAMLSTSVTTTLAFTACAVSEIWDIRCFGVVNGFMVLFDYLLVITWFPAAVLVHEKYLADCMPWCTPKNIVAKCCLLLRRGSGSSSSGGGGGAEGTSSEPPPEKKYGASSEAKDGEGEGRGSGSSSGGGGGGAEGTSSEPPPEKKSGASSEAKDGEGEAPPPHHRQHNPNGNFLENFFGGPFADFVLKYAKIISAVSLLAIVGSTLVWVLGLKPASEPFTFFNDEHWYSKMQVVLTEKFDYESIDGKVMVQLSFGLDRKEPWDPNGVHPTAINDELYENTPQRVNFDGKFDWDKAQQQFSVACRAFQEAMISSGEATDTSRYWCWADDFSKWVRTNRNDLTFPIADKDAYNAAVEEWVMAEEHTLASYDNRSRAVDTLEQDDLSYGDMTGFAKDPVSGGDVVFTFATFETKLEVLEDGYPNARVWKLYHNMEDALAAARKASGLSGGTQTCSEYHLMTLGTYLEKSAMVNVAFSLSIAVVVIFAVTKNYWLTAIASVCLYAIISLVFAEMVIFGWTINILEAVCMSIAGGMSVDYVLHMCHSYNHLPGTSQEKARATLGEMGVSVFSGAFTTFCACIALFMCDMLWFRLFGCFIAMVIITAFAVSLLTLMAFLAEAGPPAGRGYIFRYPKARDDTSNASQEDQGARVAQLELKNAPRIAPLNGNI